MTRPMRRLSKALAICLAFAVAWPALGQLGADGPSMRLEAYTETDAGHPGESLRAAVVANLTPGWHVNAHKPLDEFLIATELSIEEHSGIRVEQVAYPSPLMTSFSFSPDQVAVYEERFTLGIVLSLSEDLAPGDYVLNGTLRYQACNDKQCRGPATADVAISVKVVAAGQPVSPQYEKLFKDIMFPSTLEDAPPADDVPAPDAQEATHEAPGPWQPLAERFTITATATGYMDAGEFSAFLDAYESGDAAREMGLFEGKSLWLVLLLCLLGGAALNLTPCVLPLIPVNVAIIGAGAQAGTRTRGFLLGAMYGAGIALTYGLLGAAVVFTGATFGALNASPWFNAGIVVIFVVLALAMFEVFNIDFSRLQAKFGGKRNESGRFLTAFAMGCIAALLAGACVAPVVIAALLFAQDLYAKGSWVGLVAPFCLGVGMGLPWPFAGAGLSFLPKPGKWMMRVKYVFGVFMLLLAAYYAHLAYSLFDQRYFVDRDAVRASADMNDEGWLTALPDALAQADKEQRPVFIDFWATWCKSCMTMNQTTFKNADVKARLKDYILLKYQAEIPDDAATREVMKHFGVVGLPTYVILDPR